LPRRERNRSGIGEINPLGSPPVEEPGFEAIVERLETFDVWTAHSASMASFARSHDG
jgi:hypothetical protein